MKINLLFLIFLGSINVFAMRVHPGADVLDTVNPELISLVINKNQLVYNFVSRSYSQNISFKIDEDCTLSATKHVMIFSKNPKYSRLKVGCSASESIPGKECQNPYMILEYSDTETQQNYTFSGKCKLIESGRGMKVSI